MTKKRLNVTSIQNELSQTAYFARPVAQQRSTSRPKPPVPKQKRSKKLKKTPDKTTELKKAKIPDFESNKVSKSETHKVSNFQSYKLSNYKTFKHMGIGLTRDQVRYLQKLEDHISDTRPDIDKNNAHHKRITKASIIRVLVEMARQLELTVNARQFQNEHDLYQAMLEKMALKLSNFESRKV